MSERIQNGDVVKIVMLHGSTFGWTHAMAVIDNIPCDTGDSFRFTLLDGIKVLINPTCSDFAGLVKEEEYQKLAVLLETNND